MAAQIIPTGSKTWENRHHTFVETIAEYNEMWNDTGDDILSGYNEMTDLIRTAIAKMITDGTSMRALGGGWSWTQIATVADGCMYATKYLNTTFSVAPSLVSPYQGNPADLLFVQSGSKIFELNRYLAQRQRSLKTSGASNGQTMGGALSTGTHGSAIDFGAIPEFVVGLHIVTGPDLADSIWLERASKPVASPVFAQKIKARFVADDELFNAALVSFGSFGFIHGIMIETEPLYLLECNRQRIMNLPGLYRLMETLDFSTNNFLPYTTERPHHFQVTLNPYDLAKGAYVTTMYKRPYTPNYKPPDQFAKTGIGDDVPSFIGTLTDAVGVAIPLIVNGVIKNQYPLYSKQFGIRGEIFGDTELVGKLLSAAIGIPLSEVSRVRDILFDLNKNGAAGPFTGVFAFRFVKASTATMGFTWFTPYTCIIELDGVFCDRIKKFYEGVWARLDAEGIQYTFHWGKVNTMNPSRLANGYGGRVAKWKAARTALMAPAAIAVFNNPQIRAWGLT